MPRPYWRKMTWVLIIFTVIMFAWMIGGGISAGNSCNDYSGQYQSAKEAGCQAGTAIGVAGIFGLWVVGFIVLSLIWFMTRPRGRDCPVCGEKVKKGRTACQSCGYDFAAGAAQQEIGTGQPQGLATAVVAAAPENQYPAGWYPDPRREARERYWDGTQWTHHLRGGSDPQNYWADPIQGMPE